MAKVLVVVVTYNAMKWVNKCFGSLEKSSVEVDSVVVDNGSTDGTIEYIRTNFPEVKVIENEKNLGFGAANNEGLRLAVEEGYPYVYLLNQDAWVEPDTISRIIESFTPEYGILSPVQNDAKGRLDKRFARKCRKQLEAAAKEYRDDHAVEVPFVMAAHWLVSREALRKVGGFSPAFKHYGEDDNYIDRLHYHGLKVGVVPSAKAVHDRSERKASHKQKMNLKCVATLVKVSDPNHSFFFRRFREILELVGMSVKNISLIPLRYIPVLCSRFHELKALRSQSQQEGAFL